MSKLAAALAAVALLFAAVTSNCAHNAETAERYELCAQLDRELPASKMPARCHGYY